jgi:tRNA (guanine-N7-)-methyltransferase
MARPDRSDGKPRGAFFGRRKGHKLRAGRAELLAVRLPELALDLARPVAGTLQTMFPSPVRGVALEIGFGAGEHFVREAETNPDWGFIGCEPFVNGMASAVALIEAATVRNVRLHQGDALDLLEWLPTESIDRVDILYPDPWPKRRHWKRRLISDDNVRRLARITRAGGELRFATDIAGYAEWALLRILRSGMFDWVAEQADDWRRPWRGYISTRYEAKALRAGRRPSYFTFKRR